MQSLEIRRRFLDFFAEHQHRIVRSSSLVPQGDATLLFTNAGMNQFKDVFLGREKRDYRRAATSQKCVRAGGKHNDLENVGYTNRHLTFFEMLGNFSFGDYFKKDAIRFAWDLLTTGFGLDPARLHATVFEDDDAAFALWRDEIGLPEARIGRLGAKDNFWAMGDTGPCGPCSEIYVDTGGRDCPDAGCAPGCDCGRFVEIWNLVFMQFDRAADGSVVALPSPSIDTGMGLERICMILQDVNSVYETDLLRPIIDRAAAAAGTHYGAAENTDVALRVIADHLRSATLLLSDGVLPANTGRGYVLRRIIRRALRFGKRLGFDGVFLHGLSSEVVERMSRPFPELGDNDLHIRRVLRAEEERFQQTMAHAGKLFEDIAVTLEASRGKTIAGADAFRLYDTFGLALDTLKDMAEVRGLVVDEAGFSTQLESTRARGRESWKGASIASALPIYQRIVEAGGSDFRGYEQLLIPMVNVVAIVRDGVTLQSAGRDELVEVVLSATPFYAEGGGQLGDRGVLRWEDGDATVEDVVRPVPGVIVHRVRVRNGSLQAGIPVDAEVDRQRRQATAYNHSATHLLHAALRETLGEHVKQAGSLVAPDRLRFDFNHFAKPEETELRRIEEMVNRQVHLNNPVEAEVVSIDQALSRGALAFFGDKYGDRVRVVRMGDFSMELCGGTHVAATGNIGYVRIVASSAVAAGVRRIEAVSGDAAVLAALEERDLVEELAGRLNVPRQSLVEHVDGLRRELRDSKREIGELKLKLAAGSGPGDIDEFREIGGAKIARRFVADLDRTGLRALADQLRGKVKSGAVLLGSRQDGKGALLVAVTPDLNGRIDAGKLVREMATAVGGSGGGRKDLAEAGVPDPALVEQALEVGMKRIEQILG